MKLSSHCARAGLTARVIAVSIAPLYQSFFAKTLPPKIGRLCPFPGGMPQMFRKLLSISMSVALISALAAQSAKASEGPKEAKDVDAVFAYLAKPGSPGCALAVARNGKLVYAKGYGLANSEQNVA